MVLANGWPKFVAFVALTVGSALVFLFSRGLAPFTGIFASSAVVVGLYALIGLFWVLVFQGLAKPAQCVTGVAATTLAGAVIASRTSALPSWLVAGVSVLTAAALLFFTKLVWDDARSRSGRLDQRLWSSLLAQIPDSVRNLAAKEIELWAAIFWPSALRRRYKGLPQFSFGQHGSDALVMRVMIGIGILELFCVHLIVQAFSRPIAFTLSAISGIGLIYLFGIAQSFVSMPTTIDAKRLTIRLGALRKQDIEIHTIASAEPVAIARQGEANVLTLSIFAPANVRLHLIEPLLGHSMLGKARQYDIVEFRTDEPVRILEHLGEAAKLAREKEMQISR